MTPSAFRPALFRPTSRVNATFQGAKSVSTQHSVRFGQNPPEGNNPAQDDGDTFTLALAQQLLAGLGEAPPAKAEPLLTPNEAKQLLAEGKITQFNSKLEAWRQANPNPDQYFDMQQFPFGQILGNLEALQAISPDIDDSEPLDLRGCDLRGADFRGLKTLNALFSQQEYEADDPAPLEKHIKSALMDRTTRFSASTVKILT